MTYDQLADVLHYLRGGMIEAAEEMIEKELAKSEYVPEPLMKIIREKFNSGNSVEVERITITRAEVETAGAHLNNESFKNTVPAVRLAIEEVASSYSPAQIAKELTLTALNVGYYGNALRVAKDIPGLNDEDRALLDRYATGIALGIDHVGLQDLALKIQRIPEGTLLERNDERPDERPPLARNSPRQ